MRRINIAEGVLIFVGLMLIICGIVFKVSGENILDPAISNLRSFFVVANSCFLLALIIDKFGGN